MTDDCLRPAAIKTDTFMRIAPCGEMTIPYGETSFTELKAIYKDKINALDSGDKSAFMLDSMTMLADMRAAALECRKHGKPVYVVLNVDSELLTEHELPADAALIVMQSIGAICFGLTSDDTEILLDGIKRIKPYSQIPLAVMPKSGTLTDSELAELLSEGADVFIGLDDDSTTRFQDIISKEGYKPPEIDHIDVAGALVLADGIQFRGGLL